MANKIITIILILILIYVLWLLVFTFSPQIWEFIKTFWYIILGSSIFGTFLYLTYNSVRTNSFRRDIEIGDTCKFYILEDEEYGRIEKIETEGVTIFCFGNDETYYRTLKSIYPL